MIGSRSRETRLPKLLLVDDDPGVRQSLGEILESVAEVDTCPSAESAVYRIERKSYDIVVAGYALPGASGAALLGTVGDQEPDIAGVLIAGSDEYCKGDKPLRHRVLLKPVEPERLCSTVKQLGAIVRMRRAVSAIRGVGF